MKKNVMRWMVFFGIFALTSVVVTSCGEEDSDDKADEETASLSLSQGYLDNCASCHGASGQGSGAYPALTGVASSAFETAVRNGVSGTSMSSYTTDTYSDADLQNDVSFFNQ